MMGEDAGTSTVHSASTYMEMEECTPSASDTWPIYARETSNSLGLIEILVKSIVEGEEAKRVLPLNWIEVIGVKIITLVREHRKTETEKEGHMVRAPTKGKVFIPIVKLDSGSWVWVEATEEERRRGKMMKRVGDLVEEVEKDIHKEKEEKAKRMLRERILEVEALEKALKTAKKKMEELKDKTVDEIEVGMAEIGEIKVNLEWGRGGPLRRG